MKIVVVVPHRELGEREKTHGATRVFGAWISSERCSFKSNEKEVKGHAAISSDPEALQDLHKRLL